MLVPAPDIQQDSSSPPSGRLTAELRAKIRELEGLHKPSSRFLAFGVPEIDNCLPEGRLPLNCTHEVVSASEVALGAATGFVGAFIAKAVGKAPVVWISRSRTIFAPGLLAFDLQPENITFVHAKTDQDALWAMEEALRSPVLGAVVGEIDKADMTATRRLQLAIENGAGAGILLRSSPKATSSACVSRWTVKPSKSRPQFNVPGVGRTCWDVELSRIRGGRSAHWQVEYGDGQFALQPELPTNAHQTLVRMG